MAYYGGDPLGLNWMSMLALYSSLGNKSNTHSQNCQIGTQLQKLDGKDRIVIEGINNKIDQLISRNNVSLSGKEMVSLKDSIVAELGTIASQSGNRSSGPVVCDANSLVFDEDVKSLLSDLVKEKAKRVGPPGSEKNDDVSTQDIIDELSHQIHQTLIAPDYFKGNLYSKKVQRLVEMLEKDDEKLTINSNTPGTEAADNSRYVKNNPYFIWARTISHDKLLESVTTRYKNIKNKRVPDSVQKSVNSAFNSATNNIYTYNDVELLRFVHTLMIMNK